MQDGVPRPRPRNLNLEHGQLVTNVFRPSTSSFWRSDLSTGCGYLPDMLVAVVLRTSIWRLGIAMEVQILGMSTALVQWKRVGCRLSFWNTLYSFYIWTVHTKLSCISFVTSRISSMWFFCPVLWWGASHHLYKTFCNTRQGISKLLQDDSFNLPPMAWNTWLNSRARGPLKQRMHMHIPSRTWRASNTERWRWLRRVLSRDRGGLGCVGHPREMWDSELVAFSRCQRWGS